MGPVETPDGTAAQPIKPLIVVTSTSIVGFPRLSKISRAVRPIISDMMISFFAKFGLKLSCLLTTAFKNFTIFFNKKELEFELAPNPSFSWLFAPVKSFDLDPPAGHQLLGAHHVITESSHVVVHLFDTGRFNKVKTLRISLKKTVFLVLCCAL